MTDRLMHSARASRASAMSTARTWRLNTTRPRTNLIVCRRHNRGTGLSWELETDFDEFSASADAEAVFGGVVRVSVIMAPCSILLVVHMANDRDCDQNDDYADD